VREQPAQAIDNGESKAKARLAGVLYRLQPVEFAEDALTLIGRNSRAGIPDFYTQLVGSMAATN
jgi:hypothetical protein